MNKLSSTILIVFILLLTCSPELTFNDYNKSREYNLGGKSVVIGKVIDTENKKTLAGANVIINATTYGAAADTNGQYVIKDIAPGNYTLDCLMIGYKTKTTSEIVLKENKVSRINFELTPEEDDPIIINVN